MFVLNDVRYKNIIKIDHLTIAGGIITCIVGESGSGKTTLLKLLNHMVNYQEGTITYGNKNLKEMDAVLLRREVVMLPQVPVIFPGTVRDNLLLGLHFAKKEALDDEILLQEMEKVGLKKGLDENADKLSGGEKQRLALIRVILMNPRVLLLDEPTSALDEGTENQIIDYINQFLDKGNKSIIMVTHSRELADSLANKQVMVNNGRIINSGEVA